MCTGFPRLGVLRRLRPTRSDRPTMSPARPATSDTWRPDGIGRFPRSLRFARRRRSPALSLRPRHGYPAALHRGLPGRHPQACPRVPRRPFVKTGAHRARPLSARFEPVYLSRDVITLVPRVLLFVTLAEPAPSGDPDTFRRYQGSSHPPRHLPDQAAPSFTVPAAAGPAVKVSHPHSNHQCLAAHAD